MNDRVGRALDAIAPHLDEIVGSVGARAITEFGIDVSRLHWDMTSISLVGDYDSPEAEFIAASYGKPKDRRVDRKQVQTGLAVTGDGGIPVFHRAYDGKAGEVNQVVGAMEALKKMAASQRFLLVGDSKLVSYTNRVGAHPDPPADLRVGNSLCDCKQSLRLAHRTVRQGWRPGDHLQLLSLLIGHQQRRSTTRRQHDAHSSHSHRHTISGGRADPPPGPLRRDRRGG